MSLFNWFNRKPTHSRHRPVLEPSSALLKEDSTAPLAPGRTGHPRVSPQSPEHAAHRRTERMEQREQLYAVVRDAMVRAGVLSAGYKFKVLSLEPRGRQFLVMMDLDRAYGSETTRLSEIEALIAQTAKSRSDILVTAVYWRIHGHVAVGMPRQRRSAPERPAQASAAPRYEPIAADEVAAFRRAVSDAAATPFQACPPDAPVGPGQRLQHAPAAGDEDSDVLFQDGRAPGLSRTQYGDL